MLRSILFEIIQGSYKHSVLEEDITEEDLKITENQLKQWKVQRKTDTITISSMEIILTYITEFLYGLLKWGM